GVQDQPGPEAGQEDAQVKRPVRWRPRQADLESALVGVPEEAEDRVDDRRQREDQRRDVQTRPVELVGGEDDAQRPPRPGPPRQRSVPWPGPPSTPATAPAPP